MEHGFVCGAETPPPNTLKLGHEDGGGEYYSAVANSEWGRIPGKAKDGRCWYSYGGNEHETDDFDLVTYPVTITTVANDGNGPPPGARPIGFQNNGAGDQYAAIAITEWGRIPGKAVDKVCWYPYGGAEHTTEDFEWIICTRVRDSHHEKMDVDFVQQIRTTGKRPEVWMAK